MSVISKASFVQIPSGYGEDKLYSEVPNTTNGDFTFTRASTGTRVNADGYIEEVPWNLNNNSEDLNSYTKLNVVVTSDDIISPRGTQDADKLETTSNNSYKLLKTNSVSFVSGIDYTFSFYAKKGTTDFIQLITTNTLFGATSEWANFDLNNGVVSLDNYGGASIENIGDGWYRCKMTSTCVSSGTDGWFVSVITSGTSTRAESTSNVVNVYVWGIQVVKGSSAKTYIKTTDRLNVPRLDYTNRDCPQILIEKQATNLVTYSSELDNAAWTKSGVTITANDTTSPDGTTNADKIIASSGLSIKIAYQVQSSTNNVKHSASAFYKADEYSYAFLRVGGQTPSPYVIYNLSNQSVVSTENTISTEITDYGNGWYRVSIDYITNSTTNAPNVSFLPTTGYTLDSLNQPSYNGDGLSGGYVWGVQLESKYGNQGFKPTSYIPTNGTAVTRNFDYFKSGDLTSVLNTSQGVFYFDFLHYDSIVYGEFTIRPTDNSSTNQLYFRTQHINNPDRNITQFYITASGTSYGNYQWNDAYINMGVKYALAWDGNVIKHYINGVKKSETNATFSFSADFGEIKMSRYNSPNQYLSFHNPLRQVAYFNEMLTEEELETLTTPIATTFEALVEYWAYELL